LNHPATGAYGTNVIAWPYRILVGTAAAAVISPATPALGSPHLRCGVPEQLHQLRDRIRIHPPIPTLAGPVKLTRDGFGGPYSVRESENFAVKWQSADVSEADAQLVLDSLELAWSSFIQWGHRTPIGGDTYRVNAYVVTENDTPSSGGRTAFLGVDNEGFPCIVMSARVLDSNAASVTKIAVHEFYHVIQFSTESYYGDDGRPMSQPRISPSPSRPPRVVIARFQHDSVWHQSLLAAARQVVRA